jgi:hypothetical protein
MGPSVPVKVREIELKIEGRASEVPSCRSRSRRHFSLHRRAQYAGISGTGLS